MYYVVLHTKIQLDINYCCTNVIDIFTSEGLAEEALGRTKKKYGDVQFTIGFISSDIYHHCTICTVKGIKKGSKHKLGKSHPWKQQNEALKDN